MEFTPSTNTVALAATSSTGNVALPSRPDGFALSRQVRVVNLGPNKAFIKHGDSAVTAAATDMPILPLTVEIFDFGAETHIAGICDAAETAALRFTPGMSK